MSAEGSRRAGKPRAATRPRKAQEPRKDGRRPRGEIAAIVAAIKRFRDARDWEKFHDAKNLALCLNVEAAELLEVFLWKDAEEADPARLRDELADVFYSAFLLADKFGWDVGEIVRDKLRKNAAKYPVGKAKGSRKKYDEL